MDGLAGKEGGRVQLWGVKRKQDKANFPVLSVSHQSLPLQASELLGVLSPCHPRSAGQQLSLLLMRTLRGAHTSEKHSRVHYISTGWGLENKTAPHCFEWEWFNSIQEWVKGENPQFKPNNFVSCLQRVWTVSEVESQSCYNLLF